MRSVGYGLLLLAVSVLPAFGQASKSSAWPSLDEAHNTSACDDSPWAQAIADIKAADPERDAEKQITTRSFSLRVALDWATKTSLPPRKKPSERLAVTRLNRYRLGNLMVVGTSIRLAPQTVGVRCWLDVGAIATFVAGNRRGGAILNLNDRCARAAVALAAAYAKRFNQRMVGHPAFPHKDICVAIGNRPGGSGASSTAVPRLSDQPPPELTPTEIPNLPTAARFGLTDRVARLIEAGADVAEHDQFGFDALKWAVVRDYRPVLDLVIAAAGKPDFCAALEAAVTYKRVSLVAAFAGRCQIRERRLGLLTSAVENGNIKVVRALVEAERAVKLTGSRDVREALSAATLAGRTDLVRAILEQAANEPEFFGEWWSALRRRLLTGALAQRKLAVAERLLEGGTEPSVLEVHRAVEQRAGKIVRLLARHGTDLNSRKARPVAKTAAPRTDGLLDPLGRPPPTRRIPGDEIARRYFDPPIFLALDPLVDIKMVDLLLDLGADPNVRDTTGWTPLMVAIAHSQIYGRKDGVGWIERYVPQRLITGQEDWAHRGVEAVRALLAKGADLALTDRQGQTALHYAARSDYNVEIAEILLQHGADINARDAAGRTPLDHAHAAKLTRMPGVLTTARARR